MQMEKICVGGYRTNCYLLWQDDTCVVVDPGYEPERILEAVRAKGKTVAAILLTHGHFDHVTGVKPIAQAENCPVYIHPADGLLTALHTGGELYYTHTYEDNDTLALAGMEFCILHTPGHTPGSVCILEGDVMLSGDTLFAGTCGRTDIPPYGDPGRMQKSLARLKRLPGDYRVFPGHGQSTTLDEERRSNPYMQGL